MAGGYRRISDLPQVIPVFPLDGALLLPRGDLPLQIFEPRYLNMVDDVMAGDRIIGSLGADRLTGSLGADIFVFRSLGDSTMAVSGRDTITDFSFGQGDRIDLTAIDARSGMAGNQAFTFIGGNAFSGAAGELSARAVAGGTLISGDVNGDRVADFAILLDDPLTLGANAFLL